MVEWKFVGKTQVSLSGRTMFHFLAVHQRLTIVKERAEVLFMILIRDGLCEA